MNFLRIPSRSKAACHCCAHRRAHSDHYCGAECPKNVFHSPRDGPSGADEFAARRALLLMLCKAPDGNLGITENVTDESRHITSRAS